VVNVSETDDVDQLVEPAGERGDFDELRRLAAAGSSDAEDVLVELAAERGDLAEPRRLADGGNSDAEDVLAELAEEWSGQQRRLQRAREPSPVAVGRPPQQLVAPCSPSGGLCERLDSSIIERSLGTASHGVDHGDRPGYGRRVGMAG
jgi:hypothetical protein